MSFVIGITDRITELGPIEKKYAEQGIQFKFFNSLDEKNFKDDDLACVDVLLVWHAKVTSHTADRLKKCRLVVRYGVGYDQVDGDALARCGIPLANNPSYCTEEVADSAAAMILAGVRNIVRHDARAKNYCDNWQENTLPSWRSSRRTVGLIGIGRIGAATALRLKPFHFNLLAYDPYATTGLEKTLGLQRVDCMEDLLAVSDVVSIHCPLTPQTHGMINADFLKAMRPDSLLVNTARGKIMRSLDDLHYHLIQYPDFRATLDVLPDEPPRNHPLIEAWRTQAAWLDGRLVINPHNAYHSDAAYVDMREDVMITACNAIEKNLFRNIVNNVIPADVL